MSSTMMMDRAGMGMPGMTGVGPTTMGSPVGGSMGANWLMVPRCILKFEKCTGGMKIHCSCDDKTACGMMQNLCTMLAGGMCSCCVTFNGMTVCYCNFTMGMCKVEMTEWGCSLTCTSGDSKCCEMIQAYCDCLTTMMNAGCSCCVLMNNTPVCCGTVESTPAKTPSKR